MGNVQLILSGATLDLYDNESISLTYSVNEIKDISQRKASFSRSFQLPGSKSNNITLGHIFEVGLDGSFNPAKKAACSILVDDLPVFEGYFQLTKAYIDKQNNISYEGTVFGENDNLIKQIGESFLEDLDWTELNHTWNKDNIISSWTSTTLNYYYPLIDYGFDLEYSDLTNGLRVDQFHPGTKVKYIWDKIFETAGYTYDSAFLNSSFFDGLIIPFNGDITKVNDNDFAVQRSFRAQSTSGVSFTVSTGFTGGGMVPQYYDIVFSNDSTNGNFDNGGLYDNTTYSYSSDTYSTQRFNVVLDVSANTLSNGHMVWVVEFYRFTGTTYSSNNIFYQQSLQQWMLNGNSGTALFQTPYLDQSSSSTLRPLTPGEKVKARVKIAYTNPFATSAISGVTLANVYSANTYFYNEVSTAVLPNQTLDYNNIVPKKIKQVDFIKSIITMFNLMVEPSKDFNKKLFIEPRDDYYSSGRTITDWELDVKQKITEDLISEQQNKRIILTYKQDKDFFNEDYKNKLNKIYGEYIFDIDNDFVKDDKTIDVIFSPTPMSMVNGSIGFVAPKIGKLNNGNFESTEINIRILQKQTINVSSGESWKFDGTTFTTYPYAGHLSHPFTGTTDLNFGQLEFSYYPLSSITSSNLSELYYSKMFDEISDKNSKLITCYVNLTSNQLNQFSFRDSVYLEGVSPDGGHYFKVNKIEKNLTSPNSAKVELLRITEKFVRPRFLTALRADPNVTTITGLEVGTGGSNNSPGGLLIGKYNVIGSNSSGGMVSGYKNTIEGGSPFNAILGGSNNTIRAGVTGSTILGGDGITVEENNATYVSNLTVTENVTFSSGVTFILTGTTLDIWSSSTGNNSIIANNSTGNRAGTSFGVILGGSGNFIN